MNISIEKKDFKNSASILFDLCNKIFIKSYHKPIKNLETFIKEYKNSSAFLVHDKLIPVGLMVFEDKGNYIQINELGVLSEYQNRGIGKLLMATFFKEIKNKEVRLNTNPNNTPAIIFYLKHGFKISEWKENYYKGEPWILLKKI